MPQLGSSALWYAERGVPVLPVKPGAKYPPLLEHGLLEASTDAGQIRAWWSRWPQANIGARTGIRFDVVDIDGPLGQATRAEHWCYDEACRAAGSLPHPPPDWTEHCDHPGIFNRIDADALGKVLTPRPGGMHIYVPSSGEAGNGAGTLDGIDYRGQGGYVVVPPSVISEGWAAEHEAHAGAYAWLGAPQL